MWLAYWTDHQHGFEFFFQYNATHSNIIPINCNTFRYCYLLNDLTPDLLRSKSSSYEELQDYLRLRGREAYFLKKVRKNLLA